jgi:uncharacterized protein (DUF302 family)
MLSENPIVTLPDNGIIHLRSGHSVEQTLERLQKLLESHGIAIMARIDHAALAASAGLQMQPAVVLIFGNPKAGTPLMIASPTLALDLPLKALIWQDAEQVVWLSYNAPEYLQIRHNIPANLLPNIAGAGSILKQASDL